MSDAARRRLLDRLRPDTSRTGRARRILGTTHNLDAGFFDSDFLCTALSIAQADFAGHSGQVALQRRLAELEYAGVLCEARAYCDRPSLRTVIHPVTLRGACLHAKLVVIEYEHAVRILIGSANLTSGGYRRNRELCGEHIAQHDQPDRAAQALGILRDARDVLGTFSDRAGDFMDHLGAVMGRLEQWARSTPVVSPVIWSDAARPLWRSLIERWPAGTRVERVRIVSPCWSEDGSNDTPLRRLLGELRQRDALSERCAVELFVDSAPLTGGGHGPRFPLFVYFKDFPGLSVRVIPVDPTVDPADLDLKPDLTAARLLHAKLLVLESATHALAYAGSANFTRNGFALRPPGSANIEAGWLFELAPSGVPSVLPPVANAGEVLASLESPGEARPDEDAEAAARFWPDALLGVELAPASAPEVLELTMRWASSTPSGWTVHGPRHDQAEQLGSVLFTTEGGAARGTAPLSAEQLESILRARYVVVAAPEGVAEFPVNVAEDARQRLPLSPAGTRPGESDLLAYYQGRITFEELYPEIGAVPGNGRSPAAAARDAAHVDKNRIQAYQIRAFVDALPGIRRELLAARGSAGALHQAFLGEISPVALAKHVIDQVNARTRTATAGAFQLAELSQLLRSVAAQAPEGVEHYAEKCRAARLAIDEQLRTLCERHPAELQGASSFARYAAQLQEATP